MIADGVEIGFERAGPFGRWFDAGQLMEVVGRVRRDRHGPGRAFHRCESANRPHDCRERRDRGHRVVDGVVHGVVSGFCSRPRLSRAAAIRNASIGGVFAAAASRRTATAAPGSARRPARSRANCTRSAGAGSRPRRNRCATSSKAGMRRQIFDGVSGEGQPAGLAVDVTEPRRCGHDAFQTVCHVSDIRGGCLDLSILIVESTYDENRASLPDGRAGGGGPRRHTGDAVRVRQPRPIAVRADPRPDERAPLLPRRRRAPARTEGGAARSGQGCRQRTPLGRARARVGHHAHPRRQVLLSRPRCGEARGDGEP